jgi:hypothetical protein
MASIEERTSARYWVETSGRSLMTNESDIASSDRLYRKPRNLDIANARLERAMA